MWSVKYLSFIPAALFFPTVLTLLLLNWRQRRLRRRLRRSRIAAASQSTAPATLQAGTPEPASGGSRIPQMDWAGRTEGRGNAGETADSFFHPSDPPRIGYLIQRKSLI